MQEKVSFPQPEVESPKVGDFYYVSHCDGDIAYYRWDGGGLDISLLESNCIYLTRAEAEQRAAWNRQEMARRVVPKWFRGLGPDLEFFYPASKQWGPLDVANIEDWRNLKLAEVRAKPKPAPDVVVTVNGREYRWPATVKQGEERGDRFAVSIDVSGKFHKVFGYRMVHDYGPRTHHTREGAEAQCAALNAALGIEQGGGA